MREKFKSPHIVIIIQARMGSTRLPGKVLKEILGKPLLGYQIDRLRRVKSVGEIVVATTNQPRDQQIIDFCRREKISCFLGSEKDVLERYYQTATSNNADVIVRITSDCPLIDPEIIDKVVGFFLEHSDTYDYVSNVEKRSYPRGMDIEVFSYDALQKSARFANSPEEREHVTLYIRGHPDRFSIGSVANKKDLSKHRWTVDTEEDFQLIRQIIEALYPINPNFTMQDVLDLLHSHPKWIEINKNVQQKPVLGRQS